jgi:Leucine-rich repeat (LRR) protein
MRLWFFVKKSVWYISLMPNFKSALVCNSSINTNGDDEIQVSEAFNYSGVIRVPDLEISDMRGLEAFVNISGLFCDGNQLRRLNVRANTLLTELHCSSNQLTSLNLRSNAALTTLDCYSNKLINVDIRNG